MNRDQTAPWLEQYGDVPHHLEYEEGSIYSMFNKITHLYPNHPAYYFMGNMLTYVQADEKFLSTAKALIAAGVKKGDKVIICLPNLPQTVDSLYALNRIGAIAVMLHPLSTPSEIKRSVQIAKSRTAIVLDMFLDKFQDLRLGDEPVRLICAHISDELKGIKKAAYCLLSERKSRRREKDLNLLDITHWKDFMSHGNDVETLPPDEGKENDPAIIMFTGGSSGTPKGALLSNLNLNALSLQTVKAGNASKPGSTMLAIMPMFHGFGLGVGVHTAIGNGGASVLIPQFTPKSYIKILKKQKPNYIAGVPTLYEAMIREPSSEKLDLSYLMGVFSGGDAMTPEQHRRINEFLDKHGSPVHVREGYGLTECVSASCLTPEYGHRDRSIGVPFPDVYYKIVKPGTTEEVPVGQNGEICISGPTVMIGYIDQPEETAQTLKTHEDGYVWLHTGDLGKMDEDGFFYFIQRIKRIIVTNGYNVYPSQVEEIFDAHPYVMQSCVVGVDDTYSGQKVQAFVSLEPNVEPSDEVKEELMEYMSKTVAAYAKPHDIFFTKEMPTTLVGKVDYYKLISQEKSKQKDLSEKTN